MPSVEMTIYISSNHGDATRPKRDYWTPTNSKKRISHLTERRCEQSIMRDTSKFNHGLGNKSVERCLVTAYGLKENGGTTKDRVEGTCREFATFIKNEFRVFDLRKLDKTVINAWGEHINDRYERGEIGAGCAKNYISDINQALESARGDKSMWLSAKHDVGLPNRNGIADSYRGVSQEAHDKALSSVSERLAAQLTLQRELGLRFKESCLIDARATLVHAERTGIIKVEYGTKGGRPREFPVVSPSQLQALERAYEVQRFDRSMIPAEMSWRQYQSQCYREIKDTGVKFHGERHHYANERYQTLSGVQSPVVAGVAHGKAHHEYIANQLNITLQQAKELDQTVRLQISQELGHNRISITNNYLG